MPYLLSSKADEMKAGEKMNKLAEKILNDIRKMNLSKEVLLSLNFADLILLLAEKEKNANENDNIFLFDYIITNYTNLDAQLVHYLQLCHKDNEKKEIYNAINYLNDFNFQMAQYFDETII